MAKKKIVIIRKKQPVSEATAIADVAKKQVQKAKVKAKAKTTPKAAKLKVKNTKKPGANIDWSAIKTAYITDPKATQRSLEAQFKVSRSAIGKHMQKEEWAKQRQEYIQKAEHNVLKVASEDREQLISSVIEKHTNLLGRLSDRIAGAIDGIAHDEWEAKNIEALAKASKLVIEGERLTVGLPSDVKGLSDPRGDKLNMTIESLHEKAKAVLDGKDK